MDHHYDSNIQIHINMIKERLWSGGEYGRAAVMIGAGFSRNADKVTQNTADFPLWPELARTLKEKILDNTDRRPNIKQEDQPRDPLQLASLYELTHGRQNLDELLTNTIIDCQYRPGELHTALLQLPWSDVFTTNYDTLLERTRPQIYERNYDCVTTCSDLSRCIKPRIIKLHGSFPSSRPFIITEEDYRTYPQKFAPFVNTVQQSMMENVLCLIGFSATDPSFRSWIGWVRDNMGSSMPKIYMCILGELLHSERRLLESYNIIPINLSLISCSDSNKYHDDHHYKVIKWFLEQLAEGQRHNAMSWYDSSEMAGISSFDDSLDTHLLVQRWRETRMKYPGWVVCPHEYRKPLWNNTWVYTDRIFKICQLEDPNHALELLYEWNWRKERCLLPLFTSEADSIRAVLDVTNPYSNSKHTEGSTLTQDRTQDQNVHTSDSQQKIAMIWTDLAFAILRLYREDLDINKFTTWYKELSSNFTNNEEMLLRLAYEKSMFHLFEFDLEKLADSLSDWPDFSHYPMWQVRYSSLLAEAGEVIEAKKIAQNALTAIRKDLSLTPTNLTLLSQEGCAMLILQNIPPETFNNSSIQQMLQAIQQYRDRWEKLQTHKCNPLYEIAMVGYDFHSTEDAPSYSHHQKFDPGFETITRSYGNNNALIRAFNVIRIFEDLSVPLSSSMSSSDRETIISACSKVEDAAPWWSQCVVLRVWKNETIDSWFNRTRVAALGKNEVDKLFEPLYRNLKHTTTLGQYSNAHGMKRIVQDNVPEILSRFSIRLDNNQLNMLFDLTCDLYTSPSYRLRLYAHICSMFDRIFYAGSTTQIISWIPRLLSLFIPSDDEAKQYYWKDLEDPLTILARIKNVSTSPLKRNAEYNRSVSYLLGLVKNGNSETRARAIQRLAYVCSGDGLSKQQKTTFGKALWHQVDPKSNLPTSTGMLPYAVIGLPEKSSGEAQMALRQYFLETDYPQRVHHVDESGQKRISITTDSDFHDYMTSLKQVSVSASNTEHRSIDWTPKDISVLLHKAITWWSTYKVVYDREPNMMFNRDTDVYDLISMFATVIIPRLSQVDKQDIDNIYNLLMEIQAQGVSINHVLPALVGMCLAEPNQVSDLLCNGFLSSDANLVKSSIAGIYEWCIMSSKQDGIHVPNELVEFVVQTISLRRKPGLDLALYYISELLTYNQSMFIDKHIKSLCMGLGHLLLETDVSINPDTNLKTAEFKQRPNTRRLSTKLAYAIYRWYSSQTDTMVPDIIKKWKDAAKIDPLPEVRFAWPESN